MKMGGERGEKYMKANGPQQVTKQVKAGVYSVGIYVFLRCNLVLG